MIDGMGSLLAPFVPSLATYSGIAHHYTSASGFQGIVSTNTLWASQATELNDLSEVTRGWEIIDSWLDKQPQDELLQLIRRRSPASRRSAGTVFMACATTADDDAHQWRAYAANGQGFALAIDCSKKLLPAAEPLPKSGASAHFDGAKTEGWHRVLYDEAQVRPLLDELFANVRDRWPEQERRNSPQAELIDALLGNTVVGALAEIAHLCKHPGFSSENEVRLVVSQPAPDHIRYRASQDGLLAYVTLAAATPRDPMARPFRPGTVTLPPQVKLPITGVVLGPRQVPHGDENQRQNREQVLTSYLARLGLPALAIRTSTIPMR